MKTPLQSSHRILILSISSFLLAAFSFEGLAKDRVKFKKNGVVVVNTQGGRAKIDEHGNVISVRGRNGDAAVESARAALRKQEAVEFKQRLTTGYVIPRTHYTYLQPVPRTIVSRIPRAPAGTVYRYYDGTVYSINPRTYTVVGVVNY